MLYINIRVFGLPVHGKKIFFKFTKFYPFLPLIANSNPHSLKILPTKFGSNQLSGFGEEVV